MTGVFIKICGLCSTSAVSAALDAGADAIGFVFADSPRRLSPGVARQLAAPAEGKALRIAVMRHPTLQEWRIVDEQFRPDVLQTEAADFERLSVPAGIRRLPVYRDGASPPAAALAGDDWLLYEGLRSGSGKLADWGAAAAIASRTRRLILAGGLCVANIADALASVRPWGVDVSSGVESAPGRKDPERIAAFVAAVRKFEEQVACK